MPFSPNSLSCQKKLSSEYQLYACGNFFRHSSILEKLAILGQPPRREDKAYDVEVGQRITVNGYGFMRACWLSSRRWVSWEARKG